MTIERDPGAPSGRFERRDGRDWYTIDDVDRMPPFLMSVVSDGDRWMFASSSGALTAGRGDATCALFPYVTDDRLHASSGQLGPVTRFRVDLGDRTVAWAPFAGSRSGPSEHRSLSKSVVGDAIAFEERSDRLGLTFRYRWNTSEEFGFVRTARLVNHRDQPIRVTALDGLLDVLPFGLDPALYARRSNLTHAYKRSEMVDGPSGLAVFSLESAVSDRAEAEEVLRATTVWASGWSDAITLDPRALNRFTSSASDEPRHLLTGVPGAFLVCGDIELAPGEESSWQIVADVGRDQSDVVHLVRSIEQRRATPAAVDAASRANADALVQIMAKADALQCTADTTVCAHHYANVTYNVLRGGIARDGYRLDRADFERFVGERNRPLLRRHASWLAGLPESIDRRDLLERAAERARAVDDVHLVRLADEYLPLSFSRRHGDPSRPWNTFSIRVADDAGRPVLYYEGNWRDVFQNWEALCTSFPAYLPGVVSMFVNASTADGHNPYRVTRQGIDWEVPDPDDPWGNIGYWGDHQIVYLLRLLEACDRYLPCEIQRRLADRNHTYARVPYRIAAYEQVVDDPKSTIEFDAEADAHLRSRIADIGGDGALLVDQSNNIIVVTLLEKLLVAALAKLSNLVPGGGIWMNTQRPEWNDANNALAGYGLSMVTLFHLRRYLAHVRALVAAHADDTPLSVEMVGWLDALHAGLAEAGDLHDASLDERRRREVIDRLGITASAHRATLYRSGLSGATATVSASRLIEFCDTALRCLDQTIAVSRRPDGLVHSYNILRLPTTTTASVEHLPEMLEGQVAFISAGVSSPAQQAEVVDGLFASALFRHDQASFLLAPVRTPPSFLDKNVIEASAIEDNTLLRALREAGDRSVIRVDRGGRTRFAPELTTEDAMLARLDELGEQPEWRELVDRHRDSTRSTFDAVFGHRAYLGRSGSMYAYEGIGSIYWHMVSKLLLAVQEAADAAAGSGADADTVRRLVEAYWRVRDGLGVNKSVGEFGAIPIDPYSHTPAHAGAQQPGMTGAVKEEILTRPRELGVAVRRGQIVFDATLLRTSEFLDVETPWTYRDDAGDAHTIELPAGSFGFTICQVPVVVSRSAAEPAVEVTFADGRTETMPELEVSAAASADVFARTGAVRRIDAAIG